MAGLKPRQIRRTRQALGLSSSQFAHVLGVHPTTLSRWENSQRSAAKVEGMASAVLTALDRRLATKSATTVAGKKGQEVSDALVVGGIVLALAILVAFAAEQK